MSEKPESPKPSAVGSNLSDGLDRVLSEVALERRRQHEKWGTKQDDGNNPLDWHEIIADYNGWARRMLCMGSIDKGRRRLVQIAAIAVAAVEALDRRFPPAV